VLKRELVKNAISSRATNLITSETNLVNYKTCGGFASINGQNSFEEIFRGNKLKK